MVGIFLFLKEVFKKIYSLSVSVYFSLLFQPGLVCDNHCSLKGGKHCLKIFRVKVAGQTI